MLYQSDFKKWIEEVHGSTDWPNLQVELISTQLEFISTKAKTSRLLTPNYDIDNAAKLILDCMTSSGLIWKDDKQVISLCATKRFADTDEQSGTYLSLWVAEE